MQFRRRHCYGRITGLLALLGCAVLIIFVRHVWQTKLKIPNVPTEPTTKKAEVTSPLPITSLVNVTLSSVQQTSRSLARQEKAEKILKVEPYKYILNEPDKCREKMVFLVLLIPVEPKNIEARNAIRQTWGNESLDEGIVRIFLMGVKNDTRNAGLQHDLLRAESQTHHDIIQQDYVESYYNLTIKTLMGMHWVSSYCPNTKYVMKVDSDMFVNMAYLKKLLKANIPRKMYFTGYLMRGFKPNRNKNSKWYMPLHLYPSDRYPTFCSGTGYVFSGDMAERIYTTSLSIGRLHLEDVYVGLCLSKLNIEPTSPPNEFLFNHWRVGYSRCKYSQLITSHQFQPNELVKYWQDLQQNKHRACNRARELQRVPRK